MEEDKIKISIEDAFKLNIDWLDICENTGYNEYAIKEGLSKETIIEIPITLFKRL